MPELDSSTISIVVSSVTAVAAIVAPVISNIFTIKAQKRMKKMELYSPCVYDALAEMSEAYSCLIRKDYSDTEPTELYTRGMEKFNSFSAACYKVMALLPDEDIQQKILRLLMDRQAVYPSLLHDKLFSEIMMDINFLLHANKCKIWRRKLRQHRKDQ